MKFYYLLLCLMTIHTVFATYHPHFMNFLIKKFGKRIADGIERKELGQHASYGGGLKPADFRSRPIILVHGLGDTAETIAWNRNIIARYGGFQKKSLFATTYGQGSYEGIDTMFESMKCEYVVQIRRLIIAVTEYSRQPVDVVAFSLGSPLTRKAIKGGNCVDRRVKLGRPLSARIGTFLSVAGVNQGSSLCSDCRTILGASVCSLTFAGICNRVNGLSPNSTFLTDINNGRLYEGHHIISLDSDNDEVIGYGFNSDIPNSQRILVHNRSHVETIFETAFLQMKALKKYNKIRNKSEEEKRKEETWRRRWLKRQQKKQNNEWKQKPNKGDKTTKLQRENISTSTTQAPTATFDSASNLVTPPLEGTAFEKYFRNNDGGFSFSFTSS